MTKNSMVFLFLFFLLFQNTGLKAQDLSFLRYGGGARSLGMANAYTALAGGAEAAFWNPAFLNQRTIGTAILDYSNNDNNQGFSLGISYNLNIINLGFSHYFEYTHIKDYPPKEWFAGISISKQLIYNLSLGVTVKNIYYRRKKAAGKIWYVFDIGVGYSIFNNRLRFGAVIKNVCFTKNDAAGDINPDCAYRFGIAYNFPKNEDNVCFTTAVEFAHETENNFGYIHAEPFGYYANPDYKSTFIIGNELFFYETIFIRFSFSFPLNTDHCEDVYFFGGFGIKLSDFIFDLGGSPIEKVLSISIKYGF